MRDPRQRHGPTVPSRQMLGDIKVYTLDLSEMRVIHPLIELYSSSVLRDALQRKNTLSLREVPLRSNPKQNRFWLPAAARPHAPAIARWWLLFLSRFSQSSSIRFMERNRVDWHRPSAGRGCAAGEHSVTTPHRHAAPPLQLPPPPSPRHDKMATGPPAPRCQESGTGLRPSTGDTQYYPLAAANLCPRYGLLAQQSPKACPRTLLTLMRQRSGVTAALSAVGGRPGLARAVFAKLQVLLTTSQASLLLFYSSSSGYSIMVPCVEAITVIHHLF